MPVEGEQGIFEALYQWGKVKEDFYSNGLVYILKQLRRYERGKELATNFLNSLFDDKLSLTSDEWAIRDHTGKSTRPDIEVESVEAVAYIEVKVRSGVDYDQLQRYRKGLKRIEGKTGKKTTLLLLTAFGGDEAGEIPDLQVSWVKVREHLGEIERQLKPEHKEDEIAPETYYLVRDFRLFLKEEGMGVEQMSRYVTAEGLDDLRKFLSIIRSGCVEAGLSPQWNIGYWGEGKTDERAIGWWFNKGRKTRNYWCGFYLDNPTRVCFEITGDARKDLSARIKKDSNLKRRLKAKFPDWWHGKEDENWTGFPLDLPEDFVRRSAEKQVTLICDFVQRVLESTGEVKKLS